MVYQYRFLHVFMSLFFFYVLACLASVSVYLLFAARELFFEIMTNQYVWMLYAPWPLFVGMCLSLLFAGIIQWIYRCKIDDEKILARDSWGIELTIDPSSIVSMHTYEVPFMPLSRIRLSNVKWSVWMPKSAAMEITKGL